jgi:nucleotide-binding universal stress UspA family protein
VPDRSAPVVVGVDGSDHADRALRWAVREAHNRHVGLVLVHAYADVGLTAATSTGVEELGRRLMADVIARHRELLEELPAYDASVRPASAPATAVLDAGRHGQLVVVGTRGLGGFRELLLGSTSHRVLVHAATPVAIVPTPTTGSQIAAEELDGRRPVVVGVDEAPEARAALRWAVDEACLRGTSMLAVHGLDLPAAARLRSLGLPLELVARRLEEARTEARDRIDQLLHDNEPLGAELRVDRVVDDGSPVEALLRYATAEHLLVVGMRGRRGFAELAPGSVSHQCAHLAAGPMIAVPHRP